MGIINVEQRPELSQLYQDKHSHEASSLGQHIQHGDFDQLAQDSGSGSGEDGFRRQSGASSAISWSEMFMFTHARCTCMLTHFIVFQLQVYNATPFFRLIPFHFSPRSIGQTQSFVLTRASVHPRLASSRNGSTSALRYVPSSVDNMRACSSVHVNEGGGGGERERERERSACAHVGILVHRHRCCNDSCFLGLFGVASESQNRSLSLPLSPSIPPPPSLLTFLRSFLPPSLVVMSLTLS